MTEAQCHWPDTSVWIVDEGRGECIRYFAHGLESRNEVVVVGFHADKLWQGWDEQGPTTPLEVRWYRKRDPESLKNFARMRHERMGLPYVFLSRPGVYGSSGDHRERRLPREVKIVNAALDAIKNKHEIDKFALTGQGGGGHLVASLLALRDDITCAVIISGNVAVRKRMMIKGWPADDTGFSNFYDPMEHVSEIPYDPDLRIILVGDLRDENIPFECQRAYYEALRSGGHHAWLLRSQAGPPSFVHLLPIGFKILSRCAKGATMEEILMEIEGGAPGNKAVGE
jgi:hypothetical protein